MSWSLRFARGATLLSTFALASYSAGGTTAVWNMAVGDGGGSTQEALGKEFTRLLHEATGGGISTRIFVNGQLGSEQATVVDVSLGALDLAVVGSNNLSVFSPSLNILALPYIFENVQEAARFVTSPIAQTLSSNTQRDANVRILAWSYSGFRVLTNSRRPIRQIDDLQGLVVRVPKNAIMISTYRAWGINPSPMAWSETFTALQQKVVDGQDSPYIAIHSMKFGEVQPYLTDIHYMFQLEPLILSDAIFKKQTPELQAQLLSIGRDATRFSLQWLLDMEARIKMEMVRNYGLRIDSLEDESIWATAARRDVWPQFYHKVGGKAAIDAFLRAIKPALRQDPASAPAGPGTP